MEKADFYANARHDLSGPLAGVVVIEATTTWAGPMAGCLLADFGATVVKVEHTEGEVARRIPPFVPGSKLSVFNETVNRNKKSLSLDLRHPEGRELFLRLCRGADVVIENFKPGTLERVGLGANELLTRHPGLTWCTITGFGLESARLGYDFVVQAESGWMSITGEPDGVPSKIGVALADVLAGKDAAIAILAALAGRRGAVRSRRASPDEGAPSDVASRRFVVSLIHSATSALVNVAQNALVTGAPPRRWGNAHPNLVPYQLFDAADRALVIAVGSDAQFAACARALGLEDLVRDASLVTNAGRLAARERVVDAISRAVRTESAAHWIARLDAAGVPCGVVKPVLEALEGVDASALTGIAPRAPAMVRFAPPLLDEHGAAVRAAGWQAFAQARDARDG